MTDIAVIKANLSAQLAELEARAGRIESDLAEPLSADFAEQAVEREDDEALAGQEVLLEREIAMLRAALGRIDDGSYGQCVRCGADIAAARLDAMPETPLCIDCARSAQS